MCHNIIDGRYHPPCGHFIGMSTRHQDCFRQNCIFSSRHIHLTGPWIPPAYCRDGKLANDSRIGCKSQSCVRLMQLPVRNPIRISPTPCADCMIRERQGD
ncbi:hypothetical protein JAAARDRAFT_564059 [Jaapia argillacea MUCL 33604]|uniref:Uncharacterized protein n=1 Tax=Jaapia argillacea MUCL 33604 TaxID=933084 RepID=A0A067QE28_9AGAM|nr:hypothetical protein JAAARDRAFT_564059 [Jaapia argillacea MUCL 33604]